LGTIALRLGDVDGAIPLLERAHELDPDIHATVTALANAYHRAGDTARGRRLAMESRDLPRITYNQDDLRAEIKELAVDRRSYVRRAVVYRDVGQLDRALREAREARAVAPGDVQTELLVADLEYRTGDYAAAEASARAALRLAPDRVDVRELLARVLYQRGAVSEAETLARAVLAEQDQANMRVLLGRVEGQRGNDLAAIEHLERAVEMRPQEHEWRLALAQLLVAVGRAERGRVHLQSLVGIHPDNSTAWSALGRCELERGDRSAAQRAFERALATARNGAESELARSAMAAPPPGKSG
jgi:tetratricopeptide (TPR) repeat protein